MRTNTIELLSIQEKVVDSSTFIDIMYAHNVALGGSSAGGTTQIDNDDISFSARYELQITIPKPTDNTQNTTVYTTTQLNPLFSTTGIVYFYNIPIVNTEQHTLTIIAYNNTSNLPLATTESYFTPKTLTIIVSDQIDSEALSELNDIEIQPVLPEQSYTGFITLSENINSIDYLDIKFPLYDPIQKITLDTYKSYEICPINCFQQNINSLTGITTTDNKNNVLTGDITIKYGSDVNCIQKQPINDVTLYPCPEFSLIDSITAIESASSITTYQKYANSGIYPLLETTTGHITSVNTIKPTETGEITFNFSDDFSIYEVQTALGDTANKIGIAANNVSVDQMCAKKERSKKQLCPTTTDSEETTTTTNHDTFGTYTVYTWLSDKKKYPYWYIEPMIVPHTRITFHALDFLGLSEEEEKTILLDKLPTVISCKFIAKQIYGGEKLDMSGFSIEAADYAVDEDTTTMDADNRPVIEITRNKSNNGNILTVSLTFKQITHISGSLIYDKALQFLAKEHKDTKIIFNKNYATYRIPGYLNCTLKQNDKLYLPDSNPYNNRFCQISFYEIYPTPAAQGYKSKDSYKN